MFRMQRSTSYHIHGLQAHHFGVLTFYLVSIPPHFLSEGRTCDLKPTLSAHFAPLCLGIGSGLGS